MNFTDWDRVKHVWGNPLMSVKMRIDNYDITLQTLRDGMEVRVGIFVNGVIKGEHCLKDDNGDYSEIARKFYLKRYKQVFSNAQIKATFKTMGKKWAKANNVTKENRYYWATPYYKSFTSFKSQIKKYNDSIELIEVE